MSDSAGSCALEAMNPEQTQDSGSEDTGRFIDAPSEPDSTSGDLDEAAGACIRAYCIQFLRDQERASSVCEQVRADAAELARSGRMLRSHDWIRRIADRRCQESVEAQVQTLLACGDRRGAESELYEAYGTRILGFCLQLLGDPRAAEDAAQQALLEACRDLDRYRGGGALLGWVRAIARNRCLDAIRRRQVAARFETDADAVDEFRSTPLAPDEVLERRRLYTALIECIGRLSPRNRTTVITRFIDDEATYEDLAILLGESGSTLNRRVNRSMKDLRECLARKGHR
jgi:RNA polymerase sigma-70 factor (ECF subfamily)